MFLITRARRLRLTGATTALVVAVTLTPAGAAAYASPVLATNLTATAAADATLQEKAAALVALEIEPEPTLTGMKDCELTIAIWQRLDGKPFRDEVRAAAVAAFSDPDALAGNLAACTAFIRTGVFDAKKRDLAIEIKVKEEQRAERNLKQQAALTIGIVADTELLSLNLKEFTWAIRQKATGDQVRTAAEAAYNGTDADRAAFLATGIVSAHEADRRKEIEDQIDADEATRKKLIEDAARKRAMAVLLEVATPGMLEATDRDFITYIWENAEAGTLVRTAAEKAVLSREPADWNAFIHTGIHKAREDDRQVALRKKYEADVAAAEAVLATATKDGFHLLAVAAKKALAGTPAELGDFVERGQYDLDLNTSFETGDVPLQWEHSPAWAGAIQNVNACSVDETQMYKDRIAEENRALSVYEMQLSALQLGLAAELAKPPRDQSPAKIADLRLRIAQTKDSITVVNAAIAKWMLQAMACDAKKPENSVVTEKAHSGVRAIRYFGVDHNAAKSYAYFRAMPLNRVTVKPTTKLTYWVYPQDGSTVAHVNQYNSTCVAVDLTFSSGAPLRDSGATDQNGNRAHPAYQCGKLTPNTWNKVEVALGSRFTGRAITGLQIAYDQAANTGGFRGYIDDISITG